MDFYIIHEKLHGETSLLNKARFKHKISGMADTSEFGKADFILLIEKGVMPGWWDKETRKISYYFVSKLLDYACEVNVEQEVPVRPALSALYPNVLLPEKTRISNIKKL